MCGGSTSLVGIGFRQAGRSAKEAITPEIPEPPPPPPRLPEAPRTPGVSGARAPGEDIRRRRRAAGAGTTGTILTGPRGIEGTGAATGAKTLLGA